MKPTSKMLKGPFMTLSACIAVISAICVMGGGSLRVAHSQEGTEGKDAEVRSFFGIVQPFRKVTLSARFDDLIPVMNVEEGDEVSQGEVIAQQEYIIRRLIVERLENLANDKTAIESNKVSADILEKSYKRSQVLYKTNEESKEQLEQRELEWKRAKIAVDAAKRDLQRFALNLKAQKQDFEYTKIITPISGIVVKKYHQVGETVDQQTRKIVDIINIEHVLVEVAEIPAEMLTKVAIGDAVKVRVPALGGREFDGMVYRVSPTVDPMSQRFEVKVIVKNPWKPWKPPKTERQEPSRATPSKKKSETQNVVPYLDTFGIETPRPPRRTREFLIKPGLTAEVMFTIK